MKSSNYFLPSILAGFSASVLSTVPGIKSLSCCFIIPLAAFFAIYLLRKSAGLTNITFGQAAITGIITGIMAALFTTTIDTIIALITHTNEFVETLPETEIALKSLNLGPIFDSTFDVMKQMGKEIRETGFSLFFTIGMLFSNIITNTVFAFLGAVIARSYFNRMSGKL